MCPRLSANYVSCCPPNMAQVSVWADNLQLRGIFNILAAKRYLERKEFARQNNIPITPTV